MPEGDSTDEFLDWIKTIGAILVMDDYDDIFKMNRIHHWQIGTLLYYGGVLGSILKSLSEPDDER